MSNIIKNKNDLLLLKDIVNYTKDHELSVGYLEEIINGLLPKKDDQLLTKYYIKENGFDTALFDPNYNKIIVSINKTKQWLDRQVIDFNKEEKIIDIDKFRSYLFVFMISHEIEHAYQYLIGKGIVDAPNDVVKEAYSGIYNLMMKKHYIIPRPITKTRELISIILYQSKCNLYLLERNANILGAEAAKECARYNNDEDIYNFFDNFMRTYLICGYTDSNIGSIKETYRNILMENKYRWFYHDIEIDDRDKVRYGFEIDDNTRNKVLKLKMDI